VSPEARVSVDKLFAEPFEPLWVKWQREAALQEWLERLNLCKVKRARRRRIITDPIEIAWRREADESHRRIMANCRGVWRIC
jgi:hypothetical protein